jgi:hypothetical protein
VTSDRLADKAVIVLIDIVDVRDTAVAEKAVVEWVAALVVVVAVVWAAVVDTVVAGVQESSERCC